MPLNANGSWSLHPLDIISVSHVAGGSMLQLPHLHFRNGYPQSAMPHMCQKRLLYIYIYGIYMYAYIVKLHPFLWNLRCLQG